MSQFRGISHEQVCVLVAMDRNDHMLSRNSGMGRITAKQIDDVMGDYIAPNSLLCSDSAKNYISFAKLMENYLFWSRFLEFNKSLNKVELKRTLLTFAFATNRATTVNSLRPKKVV